MDSCQSRCAICVRILSRSVSRISFHRRHAFSPENSATVSIDQSQNHAADAANQNAENPINHLTCNSYGHIGTAVQTAMRYASQFVLSKSSTMDVQSAQSSATSRRGLRDTTYRSSEFLNARVPEHIATCLLRSGRWRRMQRSTTILSG